MSLFQLMPHLQYFRPINCCFIFLPQLGQILLLFLFSIASIYPFQPILFHYTLLFLSVQSFLHPLFPIRNISAIKIEPKKNNRKKCRNFSASLQRLFHNKFHFYIKLGITAWPWNPMCITFL